MSKITVDERGIFLRERMTARELISELKYHNIEYDAVTTQLLRIKGHELINPERLPFVTVLCHTEEHITRHTSLEMFFGASEGHVVMTHPSFLGIPDDASTLALVPYRGERTYMHVTTKNQSEFKLTALVSKGKPTLETINLSTEGHFVLGLYLFTDAVMHNVYSLTDEEAQDLFRRERS